MRIILFLVFGLIIGAVAWMIVPGRAPRGWAVAMLIGAAGAMVGGLLGSALGLNVEGSRSGFLASVLGAVGWLGLYHLIRHRASVSPGARPATRDDADRTTRPATGGAEPGPAPSVPAPAPGAPRARRDDRLRVLDRAHAGSRVARREPR